MNFNDWCTSLISDERWFELLRAYKDSTIKSCAEKVYAELVAKQIVDIRPMTENRVHVYHVIKKLPEDKPKKNWCEVKEEIAKKEEPEWKPASPEHVDKCVAEFDAMMKNSTMINGMPRISYKQRVEEGDWIPKKDATYPATSAMEVYIRERHVEYIKTCYDARTAQKLPTWMEEDEFNFIYDEANVDLLEKISRQHLKP